MSSLARTVGRATRPPPSRPARPAKARGQNSSAIISSHQRGIHSTPTCSAASKTEGQKFVVRRSRSTVPSLSSSSSSGDATRSASMRTLGLKGRQPPVHSSSMAPAWTNAPIVHSSPPASTRPQPISMLGRTADRPGREESQTSASERWKSPVLGFDDFIRESERVSDKPGRRSRPDSEGPRTPRAEPWRSSLSAFEGFVKDAGSMGASDKYSQRSSDKPPREFFGLKTATPDARPWTARGRLTGMNSPHQWEPRHGSQDGPKRIEPMTLEAIKFEEAMSTMKVRQQLAFKKYIRSKVEKRQIAKLYQYLMADLSPGVEELRRRSSRMRQWAARKSNRDARGNRLRDHQFLDKAISHTTAMIERVQICEVVVLEVLAYLAAERAVKRVRAALDAGTSTDAVHLQLLWAPCPHSEKKASTWFPSRLRTWWDKNYLMTAVNASPQQSGNQAEHPPALRRLAALPLHDPRLQPYQRAIKLALHAEIAAVEAGLGKHAKNMLQIDAMWERWYDQYQGYLNHMRFLKEAQEKKLTALSEPSEQKNRAEAEAESASVEAQPKKADKPARTVVVTPGRTFDNRIRMIPERFKTKIWT
ncbi:hypothetical protein BD289DRAFT_485146 [Coniella lustricola]|uniref:Uncharacterized protein n=1 Tax=Coniella lustricola TaxID=2025994 RepID=A0A2T2ZZK0_9PEZI|nr:hypothetical protein BD289DRAFT_485146 [Coniella lustricola]